MYAIMIIPCLLDGDFITHISLVCTRDALVRMGCEEVERGALWWGLELHTNGANKVVRRYESKPRPLLSYETMAYMNALFVVGRDEDARRLQEKVRKMSLGRFRAREDSESIVRVGLSFLKTERCWAHDGFKYVVDGDPFYAPALFYLSQTASPLSEGAEWAAKALTVERPGSQLARDAKFSLARSLTAMRRSLVRDLAAKESFPQDNWCPATRVLDWNGLGAILDRSSILKRTLSK